MIDGDSTPAAQYYDEAWQVKLQRPEYATLERRWRSRWDFVAERISTGARVLDIGCGDGVLGERLIREKACEVTGIDVSEYALDIARGRGIVSKRVDIDVSPLPFADDSFDAVIASCVLEHVAHPEHVLAEMTRVLRSGATAYVTLPNPLTWKIRLAFLRGRFHPDFLHSLPGEGIHYRFWTVDAGLEEMIAEGGWPLRVVEKSVELKNPRLGSSLRRRTKSTLIRLRPTLFGEYVHFRLEKVAA